MTSPPWYTEQAAIVLRKLQDSAGEITALERYVAACPLDRGHRTWNNGSSKHEPEKLGTNFKPGPRPHDEP